MKSLASLIGTVSQKTGDYVSLVYFAVFIITIYDVALRYFLNSPTNWGLELVIALAGIQYVIAGAHAVKNNGHVKIDFLYRLMPYRLQKVMDMVSMALAFGLMLVIVYYGYEQAYPSVIGMETSGAGWNSHAPMWMKVAIPIGAALMAAQCAVNFCSACSDLFDAR